MKNTEFIRLFKHYLSIDSVLFDENNNYDPFKARNLTPSMSHRLLKSSDLTSYSLRGWHNLFERYSALKDKSLENVADKIMHWSLWQLEDYLRIEDTEIREDNTLERVKALEPERVTAWNKHRAHLGELNKKRIAGTTSVLEMRLYTIGFHKKMFGSLKYVYHTAKDKLQKIDKAITSLALAAALATGLATTPEQDAQAYLLQQNGVRDRAIAYYEEVEEAAEYAIDNIAPIYEASITSTASPSRELIISGKKTILASKAYEDLKGHTFKTRDMDPQIQEYGTDKIKDRLVSDLREVTVSSNPYPEPLKRKAQRA